MLTNYLNEIKGIEAVAVCDRDGFIIASEGREGAGAENIIGVISAVLDSYIDRIKNEFGEASSFFNITITGDKKFAYCSTGGKSILTTIADLDSSDVELRVFSEHVASIIELILDGNEDISLEFPDIIKILSRTRGGKIPKGDYNSKLILTGDFKVGKTSLIKRFVTNSFQESYMATLGVEISKKKMNLAKETKFKFLIWDIGGQKALVKSNFYNGANAAFIVIDRTRAETLESIDGWYKEIKKSVSKKIPIVIVANKSDLIDKIEISEEKLKSVAEERGFHYILTSAKTGENVPSAFLYAAYTVLENF